MLPQVVAGILKHIADLTVFLNPTEDSYRRFGSHKAPRYVSWSGENRSQLIRIPAAQGEYRRAELRSPDPQCNPYLAFALLIWSGLDGIGQSLPLPQAADFNLYLASPETTAGYPLLPVSLREAKAAARSSVFVSQKLPRALLSPYTE